MATHIKKANTLNESMLKQELDSLFSDYPFDIAIQKSESYFEFDNSWDVILKVRFEDIDFEIHVEESDGCFIFEYSEDGWESLDAERVFEFLFFELVKQQRRGK